MRPWRASLLHSKQSRSMRPSSVRAPRRGRRCSSPSRSFTIGSACTRPWDTEPRPRLAPAWRPSPYAQRRDILIYPLHTKGGGPVSRVPNALLPEGLAVMRAWGFSYKANVVWHKIRKDGGSDGRGVGFYFRNVTELILFG